MVWIGVWCLSCSGFDGFGLTQLEMHMAGVVV